MYIKPLVLNDIAVASRLIESVSDEYSKDDFSEEGYIRFKEKVLNAGMRKNMEDGFLYWGMIENEGLIGVIAIKPPFHLFNLFVHKEHQRRGVAQALWEHVLIQLKPQSITVFSSSHAIGLYKKLGFVSSGNKVSNSELICFPMLWEKK